MPRGVASATTSAGCEMSLAPVAAGRSSASATATQPQPVQTSAIRSGDRDRKPLLHRLHDQLGGRARNQDVAGDFDSRPQNSRTPTM